jgi:t-SNARE complex subunit (syntaxin)
MIICAPLILFIFLGIWSYGVINALRFRNYVKEIKELAAIKNIVLPLYGENIYDKVSTAAEVEVFYLNWASTVSETDTNQSLEDKKKLLKYFKNGRKIKIFLLFFIGYVIVTSIAVLLKLVVTQR